MVESLSYLLDVIAKDLYAILTSIEPQWILKLSVDECSRSTESGGNVVVDISCMCRSSEDHNQSLPLNLGESLQSRHR